MMKKYYLLFIVAAVIALAGCSKKSDIATIDTATHIAQVNKALTGSWTYSYVDILTKNTIVIADTAGNVYDVTFDGNSTMTARQTVGGKETGTTLIYTYKLTSQYGYDYATVYDVSNNIVAVFQVVFKTDISKGNIYNMSLIVTQGKFYPVVYDNYNKQNYTDPAQIFYGKS